MDEKTKLIVNALVVLGLTAICVLCVIWNIHNVRRTGMTSRQAPKNVFIIAWLLLAGGMSICLTELGLPENIARAVAVPPWIAVAYFAYRINEKKTKEAVEDYMRERMGKGA